MSRWHRPRPGPGLLLGMPLLAGLLVSLGCRSGEERAAPGAPVRLVLWAWERPEDLRFLGPGGADVAFLAASLELGAEDVSERLRRQPLRLPPGARPRVVVRLEMRPGVGLAQVSEAARRRVVDRLAALAAREGTAGLQLDFDARESETAAYLTLLGELRARLPPGTFLSITALVSWCTPGGWLTRAPVDEVVPQWFRMGPEGEAHAARVRQVPTAPCGHSVGLAVDEWRGPPPGVSTVYLFNPRPWTGDTLQWARARLTP